MHGGLERLTKRGGRDGTSRDRCKVRPGAGSKGGEDTRSAVVDVPGREHLGRRTPVCDGLQFGGDPATAVLVAPPVEGDDTDRVAGDDPVAGE